MIKLILLVFVKGGSHLPELSWDRDFALKQLSGDEALLWQCVEVYLQTVKNDLNAIDIALSEQDMRAAKAAAHSFFNDRCVAIWILCRCGCFAG